ncbi:MAG TPA: ABC transporter ATP-binding protein [Planctomycetaceae bacterium]|nr:ABC transporter ATP-binding protein [Planctomycetaceae bacterium]
MKNFIRSIKEAKAYWKSLLLATVFSVIIATLWGANIGAFYPILEVTIGGKSVHTWMDEQNLDQQQRLADSQKQIRDLERQQLNVSGAQLAPISNRLQALQTQQEIDIQKLLGYQKALPWVKSWVPESPFHTVVMIVGVLMISTLVKHGFMIANDYLVGRAAVDLTRQTRQDLFAKALYLDRAAFQRHGVSTFQSHITHTTDMLCAGLTATFGAAIREPLKLIACLIGAAYICPRLLLLSLIVAPLLGWMLYAITVSIRKHTRRMLARVTDYHQVMVESLGNVQTIQAYRAEEVEQARFANSTWMTRKYRLSCILLASMTKPVIEFHGVGMLGVTIVSGAYLVLNQETQLLGITICENPLNVSQLLVFFGMLIGASDPLRRLSAVYWQIYSGIVAAESIYEILDQPTAISDPPNPVPAPKQHQTLSLRGVDFGYSADTPVLRQVNLDIPFGSTIAILGHNGSGKSTLINLLCRFYDPQNGCLMLDSVDFRKMKVSDLRSKIALVNQQTELFNQTVAYNIRYGNPGASEQQLHEAAGQAQASEFIESVLEQRYQTVVGANGQRLSGGQRQRIALARALLCNPEILILDESTSQIDMHSEQMIRQSLAAHRGRRTMIIITHREKLLELADCVYELKDGTLIQVETRTSNVTPHRDAA